MVFLFAVVVASVVCMSSHCICANCLFRHRSRYVVDDLLNAFFPRRLFGAFEKVYNFTQPHAGAMNTIASFRANVASHYNKLAIFIESLRIEWGEECTSKGRTIHSPAVCAFEQQQVSETSATHSHAHLSHHHHHRQL